MSLTGMDRRRALGTMVVAFTGGCLRLQNNGSNNDSGAQITLTEQWTQELVQDPFVHDGEIVAMRNSRGGGYIKIINKAGEQQYQSDELGGDYFLHVAGTDFEHRVAFSDDHIYASGWNQTDSARLAAFDSISGERQWTHDLAAVGPKPVIPQVAADEDRVYLVAKKSEFSDQTESLNPVIRAVSASDGRQLWEEDFSSGPLRGLAIVNSQVVVGIDETLYWLDPTSGRISSQIDLHSWHGFVQDGTTLYTADSTLRAFDLATGEQLWSLEREREPDEQCLFANNQLFCATNPGYLTAHDLNSQTKSWEIQVDHSITSQPASTGSVIFVGDSNGNYSGVDTQTGEMLYSDSQAANSLRLAGLSDFLCVAIQTREDSFAQGFTMTNR